MVVKIFNGSGMMATGCGVVAGFTSGSGIGFITTLNKDKISSE